MISPHRRLLAEQHLAQAESAAALGREHIARQERIIAALSAGDHDLQAAEELLKTLKESQVLHEEHRDRLRRELGLA
jgi:hypothetical protein